MTNAVLFAAPVDWLSFIIPLVVAIIWALNQVFGKLGQPQNPPRRVGMPPPQPRAQPAKVDEEIENFLRRAAQQRAGQQPQPRPAPQPAAPPAPAAPRTLVERPAVLPSLPSTTRRPSDLVQVEMVDEEDEGAGMKGLTVSEHVQRHLDTRSFESRASHLTKVDQADEQLSAHLHQTFDHEVGTLAARTQKAKEIAAAAATAATSSKITASGVFALLKDRNSLRNAIILQEILRRPE